MTVMEAIKRRRSIRCYENRPIEKEKLAILWEALRLAPSACNIQPWHYVIVDEPVLKEKLVTACNNQSFIAKAPIILVGCADEKNAYPRMGGYLNSFAIDLTIGFTQLTLAAYELGLGTCWIGSFKEAEVKNLLNIPLNWRVVALTPIGYPMELPKAKSRKAWAEISGYNALLVKKWEKTRKFAII